MPMGSERWRLTVAERIGVDLGLTQMAIRVRKAGRLEHTRCLAVGGLESAATRSQFHG